MKRLMYLTICFMLAWLTACDVHEFPDVREPKPEPTEIDIRLIADVNFLTPFEDVHEVTRAGRAGTKTAAGPTRLVVEAYEDNNPDGELYPPDIYESEPCLRQVIPLDERAFCDDPVELTLELVPRAYLLLAWADYQDAETGNELHYTADRLHSVCFCGTYRGNAETKDAFAANKRIDLSRYRGQRNAVVEERITLDRPLARYEIITRDVAESRRQRAAEARTGGDLSSYRVEVAYRGYLPSTYNTVTNNPSDAVQGIAFSASLAEVTETTATLAFDYVLVNGTESAVTADIRIYDDRGELVSESTGIRIPYKRNVITRIYGNFLTQSYNSGVGIDPDYDGEYDIYL